MADTNSSTGSSLRVVNFHGDEIVTFERDGVRYVAMRRICENIGLDWARQSVKLNEISEKFNCCHMPTVAADGKERDLLCMPVEKLQLWLACINPNKVAPAIRPKIELYQAESAIALHDYWTKGAAIRGDLDGIVTGLDPAVARQVGGIFKSVVHKALAEIVPAMVASELACGEFSIGKGVSAGQVIEMSGVTGARGIKGLAGHVSRRLDRMHKQRGVPVREGALGLRRAMLFDPRLAREWLTDGGKAEIQKRTAEKLGQGILPFTRPTAF